MDKESALLIKIKNSDKIAFQKIFYEFHDALFRFVAYRVQDREVAKDITQETFLRIWKNREDLKPKKSFFSLIARISTNLCYDHFRYTEVRTRHKEQIPNYGVSHYDNPEEMAQLKHLEKIIQKLVNDKIPQKCREVFILSRVEGLSNRAIAKQLKLSLRTVENQIYRALKILKKELEKYL